MAGTSALLKSAANVRNQIASYQDSLMAYEYSNSAYTDTALSTYSSYLKGRISALNATGSISDASKALTLTKALDSATKSNISATIQRENIQVLSGNATLTDKYNVVAQQFVRAQANGDMTLAQTLEGQAYSLSQSIQLQQQSSADAAATLAKANAAAQGSIATHLESSLKQLNTVMAQSGNPDKVLKAWVDSNAATFKTLGVALPTGAQPNYFNVVDGVMGAMYNHDALAAQMYAPYDPTAAQSYTDKATALRDGTTKIDTLGGSMNAMEVQQAAANQAAFVYDQNTGRYIPAAQTGYKYNPNAPTMPQPTYSGNIEKTVVLSPQQTVQLNTLNLDFKPLTSGKNAGQAGNGVEVQATAATPQWLKNVIGQNGVTNMYDQTITNPDTKAVTHNLVFQASSVSGQGKAIYTITGNNQLWESSDLGDKLISGTSASQQAPTSVFGKIGEAFMSGVKQVGSLLMGHASADALPSSMLNQATSHYTLPPIPTAPAINLPKLTIAQPTVQPTLAPAAPAPTINPAAPSPQNAAKGTVVQSGGQGISLQGGNSGGISLQGGGAGFSLQ